MKAFTYEYSKRPSATETAIRATMVFAFCCMMVHEQATAETRPHSTDTCRYELVWADEFDVDGAPDPALWNYEHGFVRNQELQWYQQDNARCEGGLLKITGRREQVENPRYEADSRDWRRNRQYAEYTSSCIESRKSFSFRYGRLEVKARIPVAPGAWPAIWTLGNRWGWPACGEIDVMEFYRVPQADVNIHHQAQAERTVPVVLANACWQGANGRDAWNTGRWPFTRWTAADADWAARFHVWRMDWTAEAIKIYLDDELLNDIPTAQADADRPGYVNPFRNDVEGFGHYILLNLAIGGCGGTPDDDAFPLVYEIDYVRVYKSKN